MAFFTDRTSRDILKLAVPALGALVAEPLFLAVDAAMVGRLGLEPLAGLGIASVVLQTIVGLMVFLAYSTTPAVARRVGAGDIGGAVASGINGMWLAVTLGIVLAVTGYLTTPALVEMFGPDAEVAAQAESYLGISMWGLPAMLIVFAGTGLLRGLQNTVTPLWVADIGFAANALLNWVFIFVLGWGIAGSATGTVVAQWGMAVAFIIIVSLLAAKHQAVTTPKMSGITSTAKLGSWLFLRTLALRIALLLTVAVATKLGTAELAGWQIVFTLSSLAAFALDSIAIAAQALIGKNLGEHNPQGVHQVLRRARGFGVVSGAAIGLVFVLLSPVAGWLFTGDAAVTALILPAVLIMALLQPLAGLAYVLDGVLMGASDARYLAILGGINLAVYLPVLLILWFWAPAGSWGLFALALAFFGVFMTARAVGLSRRIQSEDWIRYDEVEPGMPIAPVDP